MKRTRVLLLAALAVLLSAVGLVVYGQTQIPAPRFAGKLQSLLPPAPAGWTIKERAIADSPEMKEAVGELLNFDDGIFVDYTDNSGQRLSVYIAYWSPGKMSDRLVAVHTPDVCWVGGGWVKKFARPLNGLNSPNADIPTGEDRIFSAQGTEEYVWFWHLVGNQAKSYSTLSQSPWYTPVKELFTKGLNQREEQFFIRLSSNKPLETFLHGPVLPLLLKNIPWPAAKAP